MRHKEIVVCIALLGWSSLGIFCFEPSLNSTQLSTPPVVSSSSVSPKDADTENDRSSNTSLPSTNPVSQFLQSHTVVFGTIIASLIIIQALILFFMGQPIISRTGTVKLWEGDINGPENSQQILDWYTFTHVLHGFIFYAIGGGTVAIFPSLDIGIEAIFILALLIEIIWEAIENSPVIIERYRQTALANGYTGDSVINSVSDTLAMAAGFWVAYILPPLVVLGLAVAEEIILAIIIRDNLTLNIIQLIHPFESISNWQAGNIPTQPIVPQDI